MFDINRLKQKVEKELQSQNIKVYFIAFEEDEGNPYFAFCFDEKIIEEAKAAWNEHYVIDGVYDEYAYDDTEERLVKEICRIVKSKIDK